MRVPLIAALLLTGASCAWPPPPPGPPAPPEPWFYAPLGFLFTPLNPQPPGRLTLSNYSFDNARVQTLITANPDCAVQPGMAPSEFTLPLNGTRVIDTAPGWDVCWRRVMAPAPADEAPAAEPGWGEWNRAYTSSGRPVDSRL